MLRPSWDLPASEIFPERSQDLRFLIRLEFAHPNVGHNPGIVDNKKSRRSSYSQRVQGELSYVVNMHTCIA